MNKYIKILIVVFIVFPAFFANADYSETAQVIKIDKNTSDTIVQRTDGTKWLIQHNHACNSLSAEFPVSLIITGDKITKIKVTSNAVCDVYNAVPYSGEGTFVDVIKSDNELVADHQAEIIWNNKKYLIDYGKGCPYLYDFNGRTVYYSALDSKGGQMVLPGASGKCPFTFTKTLQTIETETQATTATISGLQYQAQNNQVYFYWDKVSDDTKWLYAISYSKYKLDLAMYKSWREMPNVKVMKTNYYTVRNLANGKPYYFYLAAMYTGQDQGPWTEVTATPVAGEKLLNNPDPEPFEVLMQEKTDSFRLYWPKKDSARRYYIRFYADGKQEFFKILKPDQTELIIPKDPKYLNKGLRLEVRTIPLPNKFAVSDGVYWEYKKK
jgi:hypothetical protein